MVTADGVLTITTPALKLQYVVASTEFTAATLNITSTDPASTFTSWAPGMTNSGNLLGTIKSLDEVGPISLNCTQVETVRVHDESLHCTWGLVSRDGWVVVNDTASPALDDTTGWWNVGMTTNQVDWYFFGHGHDYRGALTDYTKVRRVRFAGPWSSVLQCSRRCGVCRSVARSQCSRGMPTACGGRGGTTTRTRASSTSWIHTSPAPFLSTHTSLTWIGTRRTST